MDMELYPYMEQYPYMELYPNMELNATHHLARETLRLVTFSEWLVANLHDWANAWEALNCNSLLARTLHCKVNPMFSGEKQQILNFLSLTRLFSTVHSVPKHSVVVPSRISVLSLTRKLISSFFALIHSSLCTAPAYPSPLPIVFWHPWPYPLIQTSKRISQKLNDP